MDVKKTKEADLEAKRPTWFLFGLIIVLSALFVAFEYTSNNGNDDVDSSELDDLANEVDMIPSTTQQNRLALMAKQKPAAKAAKIKVVKDDEELPSADDPVKNSAGELDNAGEGTANGKDQEDNKGNDDDDQTAALSPIATDMKDNPLNFHIVEDLPQFPGGAVELMKWLTQNLKYPSLAQQQKIQGKVVVQFIVGKDGSISSIKLIKSLHPSCDREALRVIKMMPHWKPGIQHDKPCRTMVCVPIIFKL